MLKNYFAIIRTAIAENRQKGVRYYESHHIVPKSFGKKSTTVLLTPEEHYRAHRCLAESFKDHSLYGKKMLWAFHRMTYNNGREITEQEYAEARLLLMSLWTRPKTESFKANMSEKMKGNKNGIGGKDNWTPTEEQKQRYSEAATKRQVGKVGRESRASKGIAVYESEDGTIIEAGSGLQLSKLIGIKSVTVQYRLQQKHGVMLNGYKLYYKERFR